MNEDLLSLFPNELRQGIALGLTNRTEEIRCRIGYPASAVVCGKDHELSTVNVTAWHLDYLLERATSMSVHSYTEEIRKGYLFTLTGYRVGICGTAYYHGQLLAGVRDLTSASVRIPHEFPGCADKICPHLLKNGYRSTLILSPPGYGKTTLLRELIRKLSRAGYRVSVADERCEIAAVSNRTAGFDLGPNTDVMTGGRKGECAMMLLRSMNPQILAFDEITDQEDLDAIIQAAGCGTAMLATAHAADPVSLHHRELYRKLLNSGVFERVVWIQMKNDNRDYCIEDLSQ